MSAVAAANQAHQAVHPAPARARPDRDEAALREKFFNHRALFMPHVIPITQHACLKANSLRRPTPGASIELTI
jgi:hypothetical protein